MLAKQFKIETLKQQREFICKQLKNKLEIAKKTNGDMSYIYEGYLYHEVEEYFKKEGFNITHFSIEEGKLPIYLFTIDSKLNEEELATAEKEEYQETSGNENIVEPWGDLLSFLSQASKLTGFMRGNDGDFIDFNRFC